MATKATKDLKKKVSQKGRKTNSQVKNQSKKKTTTKKNVKKVNRPVIKSEPIVDEKKINQVSKKQQPKKISTPKNTKVITKKENVLEDRILETLFGDPKNKSKKVNNKSSKQKQKQTKKQDTNKKEVIIKKETPNIEKQLVNNEKDLSSIKKENIEIDNKKKNSIDRLLVKILFVVFVGIVIATFVLFLNLNKIDDGKDPVLSSNLKVTYDISEIDSTNNKVTITIHASSNRGLKRILLPSQKVEYFSNDSTSDVKYLVSSNGTYTFSVSDNANKVEKVEVVIDKYK